MDWYSVGALPPGKSQRAVHLAIMPEIETDPLNYGPHARRGLTAPEAAILSQGAG